MSCNIVFIIGSETEETIEETVTRIKSSFTPHSDSDVFEIMLLTSSKNIRFVQAVNWINGKYNPNCPYPYYLFIKGSKVLGESMLNQISLVRANIPTKIRIVYLDPTCDKPIEVLLNGNAIPFEQNPIIDIC